MCTCLRLRTSDLIIAGPNSHPLWQGVNKKICLFLSGSSYIRLRLGTGESAKSGKKLLAYNRL